MSGLVDSHCHIPLLSDEMEVDSILDEAKNNNIIHMLCVAVDLEGSPEIIALAKQYEMVSASVGVHPNTQHENGLVVDDITSLAGNDNVVAIGETGLDYFRSEGNTTKGGTSQGFHVTYLEMRIEVVDNENGSQVYSQSINNIKGLQLNFNAASVDAYKRASKKIESEILEELITTVF